MFQNPSFIEYDAKYSKYEHELLSYMLCYVSKFQKLLRANPKSCFKLFKYNYYLFMEQQILYPEFMLNASYILLYPKHISNIWKDPDIINILRWICCDMPYSNMSRLMYLVRREIFGNLQIMSCNILGAFRNYPEPIGIIKINNTLKVVEKLKAFYIIKMMNGHFVINC